MTDIYNQSIEMKRGTSRVVIISVTDENGVPLDLTNGHAKWWVGKSVDSVGDDVVIEKSDTSGIVISHDNSTPPLFSLNISVAPLDTETLPPRMSYYHEASVTDQAGNVYVVASGPFELDPSLTT